jgi:hypothetical protein
MKIRIRAATITPLVVGVTRGGGEVRVDPRSSGTVTAIVPRAATIYRPASTTTERPQARDRIPRQSSLCGNGARAGGADEELVRAQLEAVSPALRPPLSLNRRRLERWADFDKRFGILEHRVDRQRAFAFDLTE